MFNDIIAGNFGLVWSGYMKTDTDTDDGHAQCQNKIAIKKIKGTHFINLIITELITIKDFLKCQYIMET